MSPARTAVAPEPLVARVTALVVDGDESRRHTSIHRLRPCVDRLLGAASGELALYVVGTAAVDLVVTDLDLPGMTGEDLLNELRERGGPPVVAVLPARATRRRVAWLDAGGADCISPTDDPRALHARFHALLRRR